MCQKAKTRTRRTPHTRNILTQLRKPGRAYLLTRDHGMIRLTKKEARLLVRSGGDDLKAECRNGDIVIANRE